MKGLKGEFVFYFSIQNREIMRSAYLPLHSGKCPGWLFRRMRDLGELIGNLIIQEKGTREFLRRLSDPYWFQAFGSVLGFDWHSSGLTTTVIAALSGANLEGLEILGGERQEGPHIPDSRSKESRAGRNKQARRKDGHGSPAGRVLALHPFNGV